MWGWVGKGVAARHRRMPKETESYPGRDHGLSGGGMIFDAVDRLAAKSGGRCSWAMPVALPRHGR
jgi:hypothetical protein